MERPVLVDISRKVSLKEIPVTSDKFLIGRGLHNGCVVEDVDVSRTHCIVERNNGEWAILDKSSNGTWLNGQLLDKSRSHKLTPGDIIGLSESVKFVFKMPSSSSDKAVGESTKRSLSEDDLLNIAESVIADVEAFQAEYESEKFDETIFNNVNTNNLEVTNSNKRNSVTNSVTSNLNNFNVREKTVCTVGAINIHQPAVLNIIQQPHGSSNAQQQKVSGINIAQQMSDLNSIHWPCGSNQIQSSLASNVDCSSSSSLPSSVLQQAQTVEQQPKASCQKSTVRSQLNNLEYVEDELQCTICTEMFVEAVTLSCSHTFCKYCITQWQKNQTFCPICRTKITMQFPTRVVDNFIEKVLENASDEIKQHRRELIEQRQAANAPASAAGTLSTASTASSSSTNGRRRRAQEPIEISSGEENSDDDDYDDHMSDYSGSDWERDYDDDDWYDYNGLPGHYYGGYGHCYTCGQRGHWANGCPNKRH